MASPFAPKWPRKGSDRPAAVGTITLSISPASIKSTTSAAGVKTKTARRRGVGGPAEVHRERCDGGATLGRNESSCRTRGNTWCFVPGQKGCHFSLSRRRNRSGAPSQWIAKFSPIGDEQIFPGMSSLAIYPLAPPYILPEKLPKTAKKKTSC